MINLFKNKKNVFPFNGILIGAKLNFRFVGILI